MKTIIALSLMVSSLTAFAADAWKVIAQTKNCGRDVQVLAKEGAAYVIARDGGRETKLHSKDKKAFTSTNMEPLVFSADEYIFTQPRMVETAQPKLEFSGSGMKSSCLMTQK